jgi:hypothetical protein
MYLVTFNLLANQKKSTVNETIYLCNKTIMDLLVIKYDEMFTPQ